MIGYGKLSYEPTHTDTSEMHDYNVAEKMEDELDNQRGIDINRLKRKREEIGNALSVMEQMIIPNRLEQITKDLPYISKNGMKWIKQ
jgi:hypothetical protein